MEKQPAGNDTYLQLVTANVLRLRRQFDLAEAQCGEALRRDPGSAAAHSVMGDIARDRGDLRDAIEWYKLALDLNPGNVPDRRKLEAVIDQVYPRENAGAVEKLRENVAGQIETAAAGMRAARLPSGAYIALGLVLVVIMGVTIVALAVGRRTESRPAPVVSGPPSGAFVSGPLQPERAADAGTARPEAEPRFSEQIAPLEAMLLEGLRAEARVLDPNCQVLDTEISPRDGLVSVRISMPRVWSADDTRGSILRVAGPLASAAAKWDERVSGVRIRCDVRQEQQADQRAFVGEAGAEALSAVTTEGMSAAPEQAFSSQWWEPGLAMAGGTGPSPGAQ